MSAQSMTDAAYDVLTRYRKPVRFSDLWNRVAKQLGLTEEQSKKKISLFYTNLSLDGRFVPMKDNQWQLKNRVKFKDAVVDTSAIEIEEDDSEEDPDGEEKDEDGGVSEDY